MKLLRAYFLYILVVVHTLVSKSQSIEDFSTCVEGFSHLDGKTLSFTTQMTVLMEEKQKLSSIMINILIHGSRCPGQYCFRNADSTPICINVEHDIEQQFSLNIDAGENTFVVYDAENATQAKSATFYAEEKV
jgi:hypothetical protein